MDNHKKLLLPKHILGYLPLLGFILFLGFFGFGTLIRFSPTLPATRDDFFHGSWLTRIEKNFDSSVLFRTPLIGMWNSTKYLIFGQGLPGVVIGDEGWLYTQEEWNPLPPENIPHGTEGWKIIHQVHEVLQERGIKLVLVPIPGKNRVLGQFHSLPLSTQIEQRYDANLKSFTELGIPVVDIYGAFQQEESPESLFLKTDTHWTPLGARLAASIVAEKTLNLDGMENLQRATFVSTPLDPRIYRGDLFEFLPKPQNDGLIYRKSIGWEPFTRSLPEPDSLIPWKTTMTIGPELGLFDTPSIPVALVGTSYSGDSNWNFLGFLQEALSMDIVSFAQEGVGPFQPMLEALENPVLPEVGVQLIIWEIPERYLPKPEE